MVAFNMIVLHSGVSAASYTTEAPLAAPPVPRMLPAITCIESTSQPRAVDYVGCQDRTRSGLKCQGWDKQAPHKHGFLDDEHNFCRNPNPKSGTTIWCYTEDPVKRWEYCDPIHYDYEVNLKMKNIAYECDNNQCINATPLPNKAAAMKACDENPDCGSIVCVTPTEYGLRRWTETKTKQCDNCITFEKPQILLNAQKLARNKLLKTLPNVSGEYRVSFDALVREVDSSKRWHNMIHLSTGENRVLRGNRIPGLWLFKNGRLHVTSDVNGDLDYSTDDTQAFPLNRWVSIVVQQKKTHGVHIYSVTVDGREILEVENRDPELYQQVKVYAADPWYPAANAYIRNLQTTTCPKLLPNKSPCENDCDCKVRCSKELPKMCC